LNRGGGGQNILLPAFGRSIDETDSGEIRLLLCRKCFAGDGGDKKAIGVGAIVEVVSEN